MKLMFIMESIALQLGILFPLAVHSEPQSAVLFVFWSSRNQSAGDKLHYFTFFEFSQGVLSLPLLVLALFCYFKDLLVFPRWFSLSARDVNRNIMMFGMSWYFNIVEFILFILMFNFSSSFLCPFSSWLITVMDGITYKHTCKYSNVALGASELKVHTTWNSCWHSFKSLWSKYSFLWCQKGSVWSSKVWNSFSNQRHCQTQKQLCEGNVWKHHSLQVGL